MWTNLLPVFHFISGSFAKFMNSVAKTIKSGNLEKAFISLDIKKSIRVALGVSVGGVLAFKSFHEKTL